MKTLKMYGSAINRRFIDEAVETLRNGGIIVYPTDSLYAIGCDAMNAKAVDRLCKLKDINPDKNRLSILCADLSQASNYTRIDNRTFDIVKNYLPGPFTFILPSSNKLPKIFRGRKEVGLRVPDDAIAVSLAEALGNPLMTTTLHLHDDIDEDQSEIATAEIAEQLSRLGDISLMIDAGPRGIVPTTVVDLSDPYDPQILREGLGNFDLN